MRAGSWLASTCLSTVILAVALGQARAFDATVDAGALPDAGYASSVPSSAFTAMSAGATSPALSLAGTTGQNGVLAAGAAGSATVSAAAAVPTNKLTVFGDSYSDTADAEFPFAKWSQLLNAEGKVGSVQSFAKAGATAEGDGPRNFTGQVEAWNTASGAFVQGETTAIYMGYNDVNFQGDLANAAAIYNAQVTRLVNNGANADGRKVLLTLIHDWADTPGKAFDAANIHARTLQWNQNVLAQRAGRQNVLTVDLYTAFKKIIANPAAFGLTNVTTVDAANSGTTSLYYDRFHVGSRGQDLISQVYANALTRTNTLVEIVRGSGAAAQRFHAAVALQAALAVVPGAGEGEFGFTPLAFGGDDEAQGLSNGGVALADNADEASQSGAGFAFNIGRDTTMGLVVGAADSNTISPAAGWTTRAEGESQAVSTFLRHDMGGFRFQATATMTQDEIDQNVYDSLTDQGDHADTNGVSALVSGTVSYPVRLSGGVVTPWADVSYHRQTTEAFSIANPYVSDVSYGSTAFDNTTGTLGLRGELAPMQLGESARLRLFGGVSYTMGLAQSDYSVDVTDTAFSAGPSSQTVDQPDVSTAQASIGASLTLGVATVLSASVALTEDAAYGDDQAVLFGFSTSF